MRLVGTSVRVNGIAAPLVYASANAVAAIVPSSVSGETAQGDVSGRNVDAISDPGRAVDARHIHPGCQRLRASGRAQSGRLDQQVANPAKAGEVITLFATGLGRSGLAVSVTIGGEIATAISADSQSAGVVEVRVRILDGVRAGAGVAVSLWAGNASSPEVTIAVK